MFYFKPPRLLFFTAGMGIDALDIQKEKGEWLT
jgi:hypothetical protein